MSVRGIKYKYFGPTAINQISCYARSNNIVFVPNRCIVYCLKTISRDRNLNRSKEVNFSE